MEEKKEKEVDQVELNLRFYNQGCEVPPNALKEIKAGRLKGMSDVNPMWRMKRMTEIFGPIGFGWKYTIDRQWVECYGDEVKCFCNVSLYVRDPETKKWSDAIPGNGGSAIVQKESKGPYVNDEGYKMALTDALSIAMKPLGIGANIWYGDNAKGHNESKYEHYTKEPDFKELTKLAIAEINSVKDLDQFNNVWIKWANSYPTICSNGSEFYNAAALKSQNLRAS